VGARGAAGPDRAATGHRTWRPFARRNAAAGAIGKAARALGDPTSPKAWTHCPSAQYFQMHSNFHKGSYTRARRLSASCGPSTACACRIAVAPLPLPPEFHSLVSNLRAKTSSNSKWGTTFWKASGCHLRSHWQFWRSGRLANQAAAAQAAAAAAAAGAAATVAAGAARVVGEGKPSRGGKRGLQAAAEARAGAAAARARAQGSAAARARARARGVATR
jgi:hypothetical protein